MTRHLQGAGPGLAVCMALLCACPLTAPEAGELVYRCQSDAECLAGYRCVADLCRRPGADRDAHGDGAAVVDVPAWDGSALDRPDPDAGAVDRARIDSAITDSRATDSSTPDTAAPDTGSADLAIADARPADTATTDTAVLDGAILDQVRPDSWELDSTVEDTWLPDAAQPDSWQPDAAVVDTWQPDAAQPDTWQPDAAVEDTWQPDAAQPDTWTPVVYAQDYSSGSLDGFTPGAGSWIASGGVLQQTETCVANTDSVVDGQDWTDIEARVDVRFDTVCSSGGLRQAALLVRVAGITGCAGNRYYGCLIDVDDDDLVAAEWNGQCVTSTANWASASGLTTGVWYTLTATMIGNTLGCRVEGPGIPGYSVSRTDSTSTIASGSVGLDTWGSSVSFDNLVVEVR